MADDLDLVVAGIVIGVAGSAPMDPWALHSLADRSSREP
jgi:hypothetical protein